MGPITSPISTYGFFPLARQRPTALGWPLESRRLTFGDTSGRERPYDLVTFGILNSSACRKGVSDFRMERRQGSYKNVRATLGAEERTPGKCARLFRFGMV
jgi:hypothetical protein